MDYYIYHMFPKLLNLYGDHGNIITLCHYAKLVGLNPIVKNINDVKDIDWNEVDFMLLGGGSDREQSIVTKQLDGIKLKFKEEVENGLPVLAVCGGYQFLGNYYLDGKKNKLNGLGVLDMYTISQNKTRMVSNTIVKSEYFDDIIGFVNHAGETFHTLPTIGFATHGYGNNLEDKNEGVFYNNLIGTYIHGPLLPKNPSITFFYLKLFLEKNNMTFDFDSLDIGLETESRGVILDKIKNNIQK